MSSFTDQISFVSGNNQDLETITGLIDLFTSIEHVNNFKVEEAAADVDCQKKDNNIESRSHCHMVALMDVPSYMIPNDIIHFFSSYLNEIISIRIVRRIPSHSHSHSSSYMALILLKSYEMLKSFLNAFNGQELTSLLEPTLCCIYTVKNITIKSASTDKIDPDECERCVLCLDSISTILPKSFTTYCNHTFHIDCIVKLEAPQCPVCRFQHDSSQSSLSECSICGFQGGNNHHNSTGHEIIEGHSSPRDIWVCLVCGFIGCGISQQSHIQRHYETELHAYAINTDDGRVWDFAGDGYVHRLVLSNDTSSTSTSTSTINDTCTDGTQDVLPIKVVEVADPHNHSSHERSRVVPLSSNSFQEDMLIGRKLESVACHYNNILRWQLQQNREVFEQRLMKVKSFAAHEGVVKIPHNLVYSDDRGKDKTHVSWAHCIIHSLKQERAKVNRQIENSKARLNVSKDELDVLRQLNKSLLANKPEWQMKIQDAKSKLELAEKHYRETIPELERQVQALMENLDNHS